MPDLGSLRGGWSSKKNQKNNEGNEMNKPEEPLSYTEKSEDSD